MNVLVVAAHPDDEVLGCGGTIARLTREGHAVQIVIAGEGMNARAKEGESVDSGLVEKLHAQSESVGEFLGVSKVHFLHFPDNRFDTVALLDIVHALEEIIRQVCPDTIFTQHGGDLNIDHSLLFRAVLTATRPMANCPVKTIYGYEVGSSSEWSFQQFAPVFQMDTFFDITDTLEKKVQAMQMYETEVREFPHPRSAEAIRAKGKHWGSIAGLQAAEAFSVIRDIK